MRVALLALALVGCATPRATVVATIHGSHFKKAEYPLATLDDVIERVRPDLVLVEIRPEPFALGHYEDGPPEMTYVTLRARDRRIAVEGIDWWQESQVGTKEVEASDPACARSLAQLYARRIWPPTYAEANGAAQWQLVLDTKAESVRCLDGDKAWVERQGHFHELADLAIARHHAHRVVAFVGAEHAPQLAQHLAGTGMRVVAAPAITVRSRPAPADVIAEWRAGAARMQAAAKTAPANLRAMYEGKSASWLSIAAQQGETK